MNNKEDSCFVKVSKHLSRPGVNKRRRVKKVFRSSCAAHVAPGVTRVPPVCKYARVRWAEQPACARFVELYLKRFEPVKLSLSLPGHPFPPRATSSPSPRNNYGIICARGWAKRASCSCLWRVRSTVDFPFVPPINSKSYAVEIFFERKIPFRFFSNRLIFRAKSSILRRVEN